MPSILSNGLAFLEFVFWRLQSILKVIFYTFFSLSFFLSFFALFSFSLSFFPSSKTLHKRARLRCVHVCDFVMVCDCVCAIWIKHATFVPPQSSPICNVLQYIFILLFIVWFYSMFKILLYSYFIIPFNMLSLKVSFILLHILLSFSTICNFLFLF